MITDSVKYDEGKMRLDLLPPEAIEALGTIVTHGAVKYGENKWQGIEIKRYEAALLRHWLAWKLGKPVDEESGYPHLWHMLCNIAFIVALEERGKHAV